MGSSLKFILVLLTATLLLGCGSSDGGDYSKQAEKEVAPPRSDSPTFPPPGHALGKENLPAPAGGQKVEAPKKGG